MTFLLWIGFSFLAAHIAYTKGRSYIAFLMLSLICLPIGLIWAVFIPANPIYMEKRDINSGYMKKCCTCSELIKKDAQVCKHCGFSQFEIMK